jgi:hypothetical protein
MSKHATRVAPLHLRRAVAAHRHGPSESGRVAKVSVRHVIDKVGNAASSNSVIRVAKYCEHDRTSMRSPTKSV